MDIASFAAAIRDRPVAAALELGSLVLSFLLLLGVVAALATGSPDRPGGLWLAVVAVGAAFACFWTVGWPLFERLRERIAA